MVTPFTFVMIPLASGSGADPPGLAAQPLLFTSHNEPTISFGKEVFSPNFSWNNCTAGPQAFKTDHGDFRNVRKGGTALWTTCERPIMFSTATDTSPRTNHAESSGKPRKNYAIAVCSRLDRERKAKKKRELRWSSSRAHGRPSRLVGSIFSDAKKLWF